MPFKILPTREFEKDYKRLDKDSQDRIRSKIEEVSENPTRYKHMHYDFTGSCRVRVGKLRIVFSYSIEKQELYLEKIVFGHKY